MIQLQIFSGFALGTFGIFPLLTLPVFEHVVSDARMRVSVMPKQQFAVV